MRAYCVVRKDWLKSARSHTVFGPLMADTEWTHPLGKLIRIRIDREYTSLRLYQGCSSLSSVEGCQLPPLKNRSADPDSRRRTCRVDFGHIARSGTTWLPSESVREGSGSLQNMVQWNETINM